MPVARATAAIPPRPRIWTWLAANRRRARSSRAGRNISYWRRMVSSSIMPQRLPPPPKNCRPAVVHIQCAYFAESPYLKTYAVQVVQGRLFGMGQSKANQWIHVLLPALLAALRGLGDAPARSLTALAHKLAVSEEALAPLEEPLHSPLLLTTERNGALSAPRTLLNRRTVTVARKRTIRERTSCWSMPCSPSCSSATPLAAASMTSGLPRQHLIPYQPEAGCCRISASWPSRSPRWRSSCRRGNHRARTCHRRSKEPIRR